MADQNREPKTLQEAIIYFANPDHCQNFMIDLRWPDGAVRCPRCGSEKVVYLLNARLWKCYGKHEKAKFSLKVGTIFEDSPLGLDKWLPAMWLLVNCKNGISSYEVASDLGISQKSAWHMMHRLRFALHHGSFDKMMEGQVEVDETYIGGKARNMHKTKREQRKSDVTGNFGKAIVLGIVERKGKVRTKVVPDRKKATIAPLIKDNVKQGAELLTDEFQSAWWTATDFAHQVVNHMDTYVDGHVHTNTMENFWSLLKPR